MKAVDQDFFDAKILVVDDQEANVEVLRGLLEIKGYTNVYSTTDSREVLALVEALQPDLLLLDLMMPYMSGFEVMQALRQANRLNGLMPIMVLTADVNDQSKERALKEGAQDFLTKPFAFFEVDLRIRNLLYSVQLLKKLQQENNLLEMKVAERTQDLLKVKNRIQESETKYRVLFDSNLDSITICGINEELGVSSIVDCNSGAEHMFGYSKDELLQMHMGQIEQSSHDLHASKIDELKQKGSISYETSYLNSQGERRYMDVKVVRVEINGSVLAMHIASDVTERRKYIEAIQEQNEALKEIAWVQSHKLRAPLARMLSLIDLIKQTDPNSEENFMNYLDWLVGSSEELDAVIHEITHKVEQSKVRL